MQFLLHFKDEFLIFCMLVYYHMKIDIGSQQFDQTIFE